MPRSREWPLCSLNRRKRPERFPPDPPEAQCGYDLDAQWSDDFHHSLHTLLTGERSGYYADFGAIEQLADAVRFGWTYTGSYSEMRQRRFGNSPAGLPVEKFVVCAQNHDQVGNRMCGERLCHLVDWERAKLAAAAVILSLSRLHPILRTWTHFSDRS